jgi:hypothetical protein
MDFSNEGVAYRIVIRSSGIESLIKKQSASRRSDDVSVGRLLWRQRCTLSLLLPACAGLMLCPYAQQFLKSGAFQV